MGARAVTARRSPPEAEPPREESGTPRQPQPSSPRQISGDSPFRPIVTWISPQLRAREPDLPLSLDERCRIGHRGPRRADPEPQPELEAEP